MYASTRGSAKPLLPGRGGRPGRDQRQGSKIRFAEPVKLIPVIEVNELPSPPPPPRCASGDVDGNLQRVFSPRPAEVPVDLGSRVCTDRAAKVKRERSFLGGRSVGT